MTSYITPANAGTCRSGGHLGSCVRHKAIAARCHVSDDAQVAGMVDRTVAEFGRLDCAFNA
jgi:NAD(P)-dependent dehydrogenase (short-subunit alcohol dehydrogenase family)